MATWTDWLRDWRQIAESVPEGQYEPITMRLGGRDYDVLRISAFDAEIDGDRRVIRTATRDFDNKVALYTRRTRDIGLVRVISVRGRPRYVLEPGADALEWAADVEGVSLRELTLSAREGALGRQVARMVRQSARRSPEVIDAELQALRERAEDAEAEAELLRAELRDRMRRVTKSRPY